MLKIMPHELIASTYNLYLLIYAPRTVGKRGIISNISCPIESPIDQVSVLLHSYNYILSSVILQIPTRIILTVLYVLNNICVSKNSTCASSMY